MQFQSRVLQLLASLHVGAFASQEGQDRLAGVDAPEPVLSNDFDSFVEATLRSLHVPGLSIAVVDDGEVFSKVSLSGHLRLDGGARATR